MSRRVGSSPFFGGSTSRDSRKSFKKLRTSYADSPTVLEEVSIAGLEEIILKGLTEGNEDLTRDSFGICYGLAREGRGS